MLFIFAMYVKNIFKSHITFNSHILHWISRLYIAIIKQVGIKYCAMKYTFHYKDMGVYRIQNPFISCSIFHFLRYWACLCLSRWTHVSYSRVRKKRTLDCKARHFLFEILWSKEENLFFPLRICKKWK